MANRVKVDCRKYPGEKGRSVTIAGTVDEVVDLGWLHARAYHGHKPEEEKELKDWIRNHPEQTND